MCLEGDSLKKKEYIKVKNENKQLNNAKRQTNYLVCNIENGTVLFVYGVHPLRHAEPHALLECQAEGAVAAVAAEHRQLLGGDGLADSQVRACLAF